MEPLETTKRVLKWICIFPVTKPMATWKLMARVVFVVMLVFITLFAISAYYAFIVENIKTDLEVNINFVLYYIIILY